MKVKLFYKTFIILCLAFMFNQAKSQTWTSYPNTNNITAIAFDLQGNQWIGTTSGLVKFDGTNYTNYDWTNGLSNIYVNSIAVDNQGKIWVATKNGVSMFNGSSWVSYFTTDGLANNFVNSIAIEPGGVIWFGTLCGLTKYDGNNWTTYKINDGMVNDSINYIKIDNQGNKWIATRNGVSKYNGSTWTNYQTNTNGSLLFGDRSVLTIAIDLQNRFYFGTNCYVHRFDGLNWQTLISNTASYTYPKNFCTSLTDDQGKVWFGSSSQTFYFNESNGYVTTNNGGTSCSLKDLNGKLWFGGYNCLNTYNGINWTSVKLHSVYSLYNSPMKLLLCDSKNNLWFSSNKMNKFNGYDWEIINTSNSIISSSSITLMHEDQQKNLWFGASSGLVKYDGINYTTYNTTNGLPNNSISHINSDIQGNVWIATSGYGVTKYNGSSFTIYNTSNSGLSNNYINKIQVDEQNNKWFTTSSNGIIKYDGTNWTTYKTPTGTGSYNFSNVLIDTIGVKWFIRPSNGIARFNDVSWTEYTTANGLISNNLNGILLDHQNNIWVYSSNGVSKFDGSNWTSYTSANGLVNNYVNNGLVDNEGNIWFLSDYHGLSKFDGTNWTTYSSANSNYTFDFGMVHKDNDGDLWFSNNYDGVYKYSKCNLSTHEKFISGQTDLCKGLNNITYSIPAIVNATQYDWELPNGVTGYSTTNSISVNITQNAVSGKIQVRGKNTCGNSERISKPIIVNGSVPSLPDSIMGQRNLCKPDTMVYSVSPISNATSYIWTLPQGATGSSNGDTIKVIFGSSAQSGNITVKGHNNCGDGPATSFFININGSFPEALSITGNPNFCNTQNIQTYAVPLIANADTIIWSLPYNIPNTITNNTVTLTFQTYYSSYSTTISVYGRNSCGNGPITKMNLNSYANINLPFGNIIGNTLICSGQSTELYSLGSYSNSNIQTYHWSFPSGITSLGNQFIVSANYNSTAVSGNISVYGSNPCGISQTSILPITISNTLPANAGLITGNSTVSKGQNNIIYTTTPIANAIEYTWMLPSGATGSSKTNSISVNYGSSAISGNISVCGKNGCGPGISSSKAITINGTAPNSAGYIYGLNKVCKGQTGITYYTPAISTATSYVWTLPNGASTTDTTNSITVNFGQNAVSGQIKVRGVNAYGYGDSSVLNVIVFTSLATAPSSITGPDTLAYGQTQILYSVVNDTNANSYSWSGPQGITFSYSYIPGSIATNISVNAVGGNITVQGENACGTSAATSKPVIIGGSVPVVAGNITGLNQVCQGQTNLVYTVPAMIDATSYVWTRPDGIRDTTLTNSIVVNFSNVYSNYPTIAVYGRNKFGNSYTSSMQIAMKQLNTFGNGILGLDTVYKNQCNAIYSVIIGNYTNGDIISWNYTGNGATLAPYTPGDVVSINFSSIATSGILSMYVTYSCGQSSTITKQITVVQPIDFVQSCNSIITNYNSNSIDWGDFNNDGLMDFIYCGIDSYSTKIYKNTGNGNFTELSASNIPNVYEGSAKWGDYNNDGFLDFILIGSAGSNNFISKIYKNNGNETFSEQNNLILPALNPNFHSAASWADYNNDGFLDLLITAVYSSTSTRFTKIFKNNGNNSFTEQSNINILGSGDANFAWGDFNNDNYPDLLLTGGNVTKLYKNTKNGNFTEVTNSNLVTVSGGNTLWGDYNNDGMLDILISGDTLNGGNYLNNVIRIYKNSGNDSFIWQHQIKLEPSNLLAYQSKNYNAVWGDYNNDGLLDILTSWNPDYSTTTSDLVLYINNGDNTFSDRFIKNTNLRNDAILNMADIDNDGDLDGMQNYLIYKTKTGSTNSIEYGMSFYKNHTLAINTNPIPPVNLSSTTNNKNAKINWYRGFDAETPQKGLSYNLRIGTTPGGSDIMNPSSDPITGKRKIVALGNASQDTSWIIKNLAPGTYYWAVQSIDNAYNGSVFSQESSFAICANQITASSTITGQSAICAGQNNFTYKVTPLANATSYSWLLPFGATGNSNSDSIVVNFATNAVSGNIRVKGINACGQSDSIIYPITVYNSIPSAPDVIYGISTICAGIDSVFFSTPLLSNATSYIWSSSIANTINNSPNYTYLIIINNAQTAYISVKGVNVCGISDSLSKILIINPKPAMPSIISGSQDLCMGQTNVPYSINPVQNANFYQWTLPNGITGISSTNSINVNATNLANGNIIVKGINNCGFGLPTSLSVVVNSNMPDPAGIISGPINIVAGQSNVTYSTTAINNATSYIWRLPDGNSDTTSTNNITYSFNLNAQSGYISVKGINGCGEGDTSFIAITVVNAVPSSAGIISGLTTVCQGSNNVVYSVPTIANATSYIWNLPNGMNGTSLSNTISVNYETNVQSGIITVKGRNLLGDGDSAVLAITVNQLPSIPTEIFGDTLVCQGQNNVKYKINPLPDATSYSWTLPNGVTGISTTDSIIVNFANNAQSDSIIVKGQNSCGVGFGKSLNFIIKPLPENAGIITGTSTVCQGQNSIIYNTIPIPEATSYVWTLPNGVTGNSDSASITAAFGPTALSGNITVKGSNQCGMGISSSYAVNVQNLVPTIAGTISGYASVCLNNNNIAYTVPVISNATSYLWTLPTGSTGNSATNSIQVSFGSSAVSGNITVKGINSCGLGLESIKAVTVGGTPLAAGIINGTNTVCQGQSNVTYTVPVILNATSYTWTLPSGASGSSSTNSITISFNSSAVSGNITVKGVSNCGSGSISTYAVTVTPIPSTAGIIVGFNTICSNQNNVNYLIANINNATSYIWTLPSGATGSSNSNSINVNFINYTLSGSITVKGQNSCGAGQSASLLVNASQIPGNAGVIYGTNTVCQGQTNLNYSVSMIPNATSYVWSLPNGASGYSTTSNINVNYSGNSLPGTISVYGHNLCGDGPSSSLPITVNSLPNSAAAITGSTQICQGQTNVTYNTAAIANATSFIWTFPNGATGSSNTNSIMLDYAGNAQSGNITTKGHNTCGDGLPSSLAITVNPTPQTPVITQHGDTLQSNIATGNQWFNLTTGILSGANAIHYIPQVTGNYFVIVTQNSCKSDSSNVIYFNNTGISDYKNDGISIKLMPNPFTQSTTIYYTLNQTLSIRISIHDVTGRELKELIDQKQDKGEHQIEFNAGNLPSGVYYFRLKSGDHIFTEKLILTK